MPVTSGSPPTWSWRIWLAVTAAASTLSSATGCGVPATVVAGSSNTVVSEAEPSSPASVTQPIGPSWRPFDDRISAMTWTDGPWPFTVSEGTLTCTNLRGLEALTLTSNGITYALNEAAKGAGSYPAIDPIWRADPDVPGSRINIAEVIDHARTLCGR
jgi:hypothetical protein